MGWSSSCGEAQKKETLNTHENPTQPKWVVDSIKGTKGRTIVVDVWAVVVPWEAAGVAITDAFRKGLTNYFVVKPLGYPSNRVWFVANSNDEYLAICGPCG